LLSWGIHREMNMIEVHFDGACEPRNPGGVAAYGYVCKVGLVVIGQGSGLACQPWTDNASNNVAEYMGMVMALEFLICHGYTDSEVVVKGDSELVIDQVNGKKSVRADRIVPLHERAKELAGRFGSIAFEWIPKDVNEDADALSREVCYQHITRFSNRRRNEEPATEKQKRLMNVLGIRYDESVTKREASNLISARLGGGISPAGG